MKGLLISRGYSILFVYTWNQSYKKFSLEFDTTYVGIGQTEANHGDAKNDHVIAVIG